MDFKKAMLERRLRSAVKDADGRKLLDVLTSDSTLGGRLLYDMGPAAGPALADAVRTARTEEEMRAAIGWAGSSGDSKALDEVRNVLRQGSPAARMEAMSTLLVHGTPDDAEHIAGCLTDPDDGFRTAVFNRLSEIERIGGRDSLPASVVAALSAERTRRTDAERAELESEMDGPFTEVSAAKVLVSLCNEVDATYSDPAPPDADDRRASLRKDIARVGDALYEQGGEDLMRDVARLVASASSHGDFLSREWTGIGGWMG